MLGCTVFESYYSFVKHILVHLHSLMGRSDSTTILYKTEPVPPNLVTVSFIV